MKLEVGMYVRTPKGIGRIETIEEDRSEITFNCDSGLSISFVKRGFTKEEMANTYKHSNNIIDLIEVGDYVNGKLVEDIFDKTNYADKSIKLKGSGDYWYNEHIKSIVTKEQFESMEYKVV